eukprot:CAMPEP_0201944194 /NCGR_PEP_ID=MMETSP0903-20130614/52656_1 /ASSEMBLY_ACC=CAM_ASM_000552 /TAXON_ID=420261 /ORGANISM="Thalassiosira antarctica, Strain CCMP982" /LENGTH=39 /DNA_ID= /DNA_START= /DNA_END= /DNA_ORIENTATION=
MTGDDESEFVGLHIGAGSNLYSWGENQYNSSSFPKRTEE